MKEREEFFLMIMHLNLKLFRKDFQGCKKLQTGNQKNYYKVESVE